MTGEEASYLLVRNATRVYAIDLRHVAETAPLLPIEPLATAPSFVLGIAVVRGAPTAVLDLGALMGGEKSHPLRLVMLRVGTRLVALAVEGVTGVQRLDPGALHALPPLAGDANAERVEAIGLLDAELLVVLRCARLVPDGVLDALVQEERAT